MAATMSQTERDQLIAYWRQARRNRIEDRSEARSDREGDRIEHEIDEIDAKIDALEAAGKGAL